MSNMEVDIFAENSFGKAALKKMRRHGDLPENFRLYEAGYVEDDPKDFNVMKVRGAVFRRAKTGPNKGNLSIKVPGTERSACVTPEECKEFE